MDFFYRCAVKDLRRIRNDLWKPVLWAGIPLVIGVLITLASGGGDGPRPTVELLVADEDDSWLSKMLIGGFSQLGDRPLFHVQTVDRREGRRRLESDDASALLIVPAGFGQAVLAEQPCQLVLITNPAQQILPRIAEESIGILVDGAFYAHRVLGDEIDALVAGPPAGDAQREDEFVAETSLRISRAVRRVAAHLDPLAISLETAADPVASESGAAGGGGEPGFDFYFFPGMLLMALVFIGEGLSWDLWVERNSGALRRLATTPRRLATFLAGKLAAGGVLIGVISWGLLLLGLVYHGRPLSSLPLALAWMTLSGLVLTVLLYLIQLHVSSQRAGAVVTNSLMFPLLMMGGSFFPFEAMPNWMAAVGRWTPNGWMLQQLKAILLGQVEVVPLAVSAIALTAVLAVLFMLSVRRLAATAARR